MCHDRCRVSPGSVIDRVGALLVAANSLEHELFELYVTVSGVARDDALNQCSGQTMGQLLPRLLAAYRGRILDTGLLAGAGWMEDSLRRAVDRRNEFVHASYSHDRGHHQAFTTSTAKREKGQQQALEEVFREWIQINVFGQTHALWQGHRQLDRPSRRYADSPRACPAGGPRSSVRIIEDKRGLSPWCVTSVYAQADDPLRANALESPGIYDAVKGSVVHPNIDPARGNLIGLDDGYEYVYLPVDEPEGGVNAWVIHQVLKAGRRVLQVCSTALRVCERDL